jgi:hypothetical protein
MLATETSIVFKSFAAKLLLKRIRRQGRTLEDHNPVIMLRPCEDFWHRYQSTDIIINQGEVAGSKSCAIAENCKLPS